MRRVGAVPTWRRWTGLSTVDWTRVCCCQLVEWVDHLHLHQMSSILKASLKTIIDDARGVLRPSGCLDLLLDSHSDHDFWRWIRRWGKIVELRFIWGSRKTGWFAVVVFDLEDSFARLYPAAVSCLSLQTWNNTVVWIRRQRPRLRTPCLSLRARRFVN